MRDQRPERPPDFERNFPGCPIEVRRALTALRRSLTQAAFDPCDISNAEIVLAEVLNNVVEHSYGGTSGPVELQVWLDRDGARFLVADAGTPLPGGRPPPAHAGVPCAEPAALPEGGFGWQLIRGLAEEIDYVSYPERNRLRGRIRRRHRPAPP